MTLVGAVVFRLFVLPEAQWTADSSDDASDRARRLASAVFVLFAVTTVTRLMAQSDLIADAQRIAGIGDGRRSRHAMGARVADRCVSGLVAIVGCSGAARVVGLDRRRLGRGRHLRSAKAMTGHAAAVRRAGSSVAADVAHVLGAGGWLGGLAASCCVEFRRCAARSAPIWTSPVRASFVRIIGRRRVCGARRRDGGSSRRGCGLAHFSDFWTTDIWHVALRKIVSSCSRSGSACYHWRTAVTRVGRDTRKRSFLADRRRRTDRSARSSSPFTAVLIIHTVSRAMTSTDRRTIDDIRAARERIAPYLSPTPFRHYPQLARADRRRT